MNLYWIKSSVYKLRYIPIGLIDIYRAIISPFFSPACRFTPTCSSYARIVIERHGILKGGMKSLIRLSKCHPFHPGGYDPPE